jgi:ketopantoate reductase
MRITIVGAGSVGTYLAKYLSGEHMDIYIIDKDAGKQPFEIKRVLLTGGDKVTEMTLNNAPKRFTPRLRASPTTNWAHAFPALPRSYGCYTLC